MGTPSHGPICRPGGAWMQQGRDSQSHRAAKQFPIFPLLKAPGVGQTWLSARSSSVWSPFSLPQHRATGRAKTQGLGSGGGVIKTVKGLCYVWGAAHRAWPRQCQGLPWLHLPSTHQSWGAELCLWVGAPGRLLTVSSRSHPVTELGLSVVRGCAVGPGCDCCCALTPESHTV